MAELVSFIICHFIFSFVIYSCLYVCYFSYLPFYFIFLIRLIKCMYLTGFTFRVALF
jgi:hypothetical protein